MISVWGFRTAEARRGCGCSLATGPAAWLPSLLQNLLLSLRAERRGRFFIVKNRLCWAQTVTGDRCRWCRQALRVMTMSCSRAIAIVWREMVKRTGSDPAYEMPCLPAVIVILLQYFKTNIRIVSQQQCPTQHNRQEVSSWTSTCRQCRCFRPQLTPSFQCYFLCEPYCAILWLSCSMLFAVILSLISLYTAVYCCTALQSAVFKRALWINSDMIWHQYLLIFNTLNCI